MQLSKLTSKGQMTIPASIRRHFRLHTGDTMKCFIEEDRIVLVPARSSVRDLKGLVPTPGEPVPIKKMNEDLELEANERMGSL